MSEVVAFVLGAIFGGCVGLLMCALCVASDHESRARERLWPKLEEIPKEEKHGEKV